MGKRFKHDRSGLVYRGGLSYLRTDFVFPIEKYVTEDMKRRLTWWRKLWTRFIIWCEKLFIERR